MWVSDYNGSCCLQAAFLTGGIGALKKMENLAFWTRPRAGRRMAALLASVVVMGFGVAVFKLVGFGTDPCSTFNLGLANCTGLSFGTWQLLMNLVLCIPVLCCDLSRIGVGTLANMLVVGYSADWILSLLSPHLSPESPLGLRLVLFAVSMAVFLLAAAFYIASDLGVAPYDAVPQMIARRVRRLSARVVRILWDIAFLTAGFLMGATVGLTTVLTGFCLGPAIAAVGKRTRAWFQ